MFLSSFTFFLFIYTYRSKISRNFQKIKTTGRKIIIVSFGCPFCYTAKIQYIRSAQPGTVTFDIRRRRAVIYTKWAGIRVSLTIHALSHHRCTDSYNYTDIWFTTLTWQLIRNKKTHYTLCATTHSIRCTACACAYTAGCDAMKLLA